MNHSNRSLLELVIVGLVSGFAGALVTTLLRIRADREEQIRDRMLLAADDLVTGFVQAFISLRKFITAHNDGDPATALAEVKEIRRLTDEVVARFARVELLFGRNKPAAVEAAKIIAFLSEGLLEAEKYPRTDVAAARKSFSEAATHEGKFVEHAYREVTKRRLKSSDEGDPVTTI